MGVKLGPLLREFGEEVGIEYLEGKKIAIDAYPTLYQMLATIRDRRGRPLRDSEGRITSHLVGVFNRTSKMLFKGLRPIFVFDGAPHPLKRKEVKERKERRDKAKEKYQKALKAGEVKEAKKFAQQAIKVEETIEDSAKTLITLMGVPVIDAPHDAEAQASYLVKEGRCFGVVSPDWDSFLFGSPRVIRNLRMVKAVKPKIFKLEDILHGLELSPSQLIYIGLLLGTDFNPGGVKGVGPKTAPKLVRKYESLDEILSKKDIEWKHAFPSPEKIIEYFKNPPIKEDVEITFNTVDRNGIIEFLVKERDFSRDRVIKQLNKIKKRKRKEKKQGIQSSLEKFT